MRIGERDNFLSIELNLLEGGYPAYRVEAAATASGCRFAAAHDRVMLDSSEAIRRRLAEFESFKCEQLEIPMTEGGWLRFQRNSRGYITVRYRVGCRGRFATAGAEVTAAMEGEIVVEGEFAAAFCNEIRSLLEA